MIRRAAWCAAALVAVALQAPGAVLADGEPPARKEFTGGFAPFLFGSFMASAVTGDASFPVGMGGEGGLGFRVDATTLRIVGGGTGHQLRDGKTLSLGNNLAVADDWSFTWFGVDQQFYSNSDHLGGSFYTAGAAFAFFTHSQKDNVTGWRVNAGVGHELKLAFMVAMPFAVEAAYIHAGGAKAAGRKIHINAFDEFTLSLKVGFSIYNPDEFQ